MLGSSLVLAAAKWTTGSRSPTWTEDKTAGSGWTTCTSSPPSFGCPTAAGSSSTLQYFKASRVNYFNRNSAGIAGCSSST